MYVSCGRAWGVWHGGVSNVYVLLVKRLFIWDSMTTVMRTGGPSWSAIHAETAAWCKENGAGMSDSGGHFVLVIDIGASREHFVDEDTGVDPSRRGEGGERRFEFAVGGRTAWPWGLVLDPGVDVVRFEHVFSCYVPRVRRI